MLLSGYKKTTKRICKGKYQLKLGHRELLVIIRLPSLSLMPHRKNSQREETQTPQKSSRPWFDFAH